MAYLQFYISTRLTCRQPKCFNLTVLSIIDDNDNRETKSNRDRDRGRGAAKHSMPSG
jgi:hypothetical protein